MGNKRDARAVLVERIRSSPPRFVRVAGSVHNAQLEPAPNPAEVDHVWITLDVPPYGRVRAAVNTISRISRVSGFDPRVRVGIMRGTWTALPEAGLSELDGLSYGTIETSANVFYEVIEQTLLEEMLIEKSKRALAVEVWGELYARREIGIHQIHSRRASHAVPVDVPERDGAIKFYFSERQQSELLLFKFAGQR
jgi:hypothetical protein